MAKKNKMYRIRNQSSNPWSFPVYEDIVETQERRRVINRQVDGEVVTEIVDETVEIPKRKATKEIEVPPTYKLGDPQYSEPFDEDTLDKLKEAPRFESLMDASNAFAIEPYQG